VSVNYKRNEQFLNLKKVKVEMFGWLPIKLQFINFTNLVEWLMLMRRNTLRYILDKVAIRIFNYLSIMKFSYLF
jgi:hypothetical protein